MADSTSPEPGSDRTDGDRTDGATTTVSDVRPGVVVVYGDIGCPWASLAVHRLVRRRDERGLDGQVVLDHRAFPLELVNGRVTPRALLDAEITVIASHEPSLGWQPWQEDPSAWPGTTLLALEAVQTAKAPQVGGLPASEELDAALRHAWYAESRPIQLWAVVLDVARRCERVDADALEALLRGGAGRAQVVAQWQQAKPSGVQGSPHLFTAGGYDVHNPGISLAWTKGPMQGVPVIERDDADAYDEVLDHALKG